ncbi:MAG: hypothetical protein ABF649_06330 [Bacillus sp. (in: firmicutes)]
MEYISIVAIVVGFIFSLLKKEKTSRSNNPSTQQKDIHAPARKMVVAEIPAVVQTQENLIERELTELEKLKKEKALLEKKLRSLEMYTKNAQNPSSASAKHPNGLFSKENVVDAVIFSEVLSPPRAKRGLRSYN